MSELPQERIAEIEAEIMSMPPSVIIRALDRLLSTAQRRIDILEATLMDVLYEATQDSDEDSWPEYIHDAYKVLYGDEYGQPAEELENAE